MFGVLPSVEAVPDADVLAPLGVRSVERALQARNRVSGAGSSGKGEAGHGSQRPLTRIVGKRRILLRGSAKDGALSPDPGRGRYSEAFDMSDMSGHAALVPSGRPRAAVALREQRQ